MAMRGRGLISILENIALLCENKNICFAITFILYVLYIQGKYIIEHIYKYKANVTRE